MERRWMPLVLADPEYVERLKRHIGSRVLEDEAGCWIWQGRPNNSGYGLVSLRRGWGKPTAHNLSYAVFVGEIPAGLDVHHQCDVKLCVNPEHLRPASRSENLKLRPTGWSYHATITHCPDGHEYSEENTRSKHRPDGSFKQRVCIACTRQGER